MRKVFIKTFFKLLVVLGVVFVLQNEPPKQASANQVEKPNAAATTSTVSQVKVEPTVPSAPTVTPQVSTPPPPKSNREIGQELASGYGWVGQEWICLERLWTGESNWNHLSYNSSSGATGIPQSLPGNKMASAGADWQTNPSTQIKWGLSYIAGRYGTPCSAWNSWNSRSPHWY